MYNPKDSERIDAVTIKGPDRDTGVGGIEAGTLSKELQGQLGSQFAISGGNFLDKDQYYIVVFNYQLNNMDDGAKDALGILGIETFDAPVSPEGNFVPGSTNSEKKASCIKIPFQFLDDIKISERTPTYSSQEVLGRFEPLAVWSGMSTMKISLTLRYVAMGNDNGNFYDEVWVDKITSLIKSLVYPTYINSNPNSANGTPSQVRYNVPPRLFLKVGDLVSDIPCYMESCSRDWADSGKYVSLSQGSTEDDIKRLRGSAFRSVNQRTTEEEIDIKLNEIRTQKKSEFLPYSQKLEISLASFYETNYKVDSTTVRKRQWRGVSILGGDNVSK